jgi:hypothetical protein
MGGGWGDVADKQSTAVLPASTFACMDEIEKFCKDIPPGKGELLLCLSKRKPELSRLCSDKIEMHLAKMEEAKRICAADIQKFCPGVEPGQGRLLKCMQPQLENISPACREKVEYYGGTSSPQPVPAKQGG